MYFNLLDLALQNKQIKADILADQLIIHLDYPIAQAQLRGEINLKKEPLATRQQIADLVFRVISGLETRVSLKRQRSHSPPPNNYFNPKVQVAEIPRQTAPVPPAKAGLQQNKNKGGVKKKPKHKQIGSKIA